MRQNCAYHYRHRLKQGLSADMIGRAQHWNLLDRRCAIAAPSKANVAHGPVLRFEHGANARVNA
jgi:hypothetical protein